MASSFNNDYNNKSLKGRLKEKIIIVVSPSAFTKDIKPNYFERSVDSELLQKGGPKWGVG